jgi:hypothetical protein
MRPTSQLQEEHHQVCQKSETKFAMESGRGANHLPAATNVSYSVPFYHCTSINLSIRVGTHHARPVLVDGVGLMLTMQRARIGAQ